MPESKPWLTMLAATGLFSAMVTGSNAAGLTKFAPVFTDHLVVSTASRFSGEERLKRLLRPHSRLSNPITQSVRDATGDPDIVVFDRRGGSSDDIYRCSYITYKGKRALTCD